MTWFIIIAVTNIMKICNILREARRLYNDKDVIFKRRLKSYQIWNKNIAHDRQKSGYRIARTTRFWDNINKGNNKITELRTIL